MHIFYFCFEKISQKGSANTHVIEVVNNLAKTGHNITLFLPRFDRKMINFYRDRIDYVYIPVYKAGLLTWIIYDIYSIIFLLLYSVRHRPDIIYFRETQSWVPLFFSKMIHRKLLIEVNGWILDELKMINYPAWKLELMRTTQRFNLRHASGIVAVSSGLKQIIQKTYTVNPSKIAVIPNGTNPVIFKPLDTIQCREKIHLTPELNYIGFIGSCYPYHGIEYLIQAAPLVLKEFPDVRFIIAGDGSARKSWQSLTAELDLTDKFIFPGMIPTAEAPIWINAFSIGVAPWHKKYMDDIGFSPIKLFDYMACSKPVVVSRIKGVTEIVEKNQCGFAIDTENPEIFAEYLLILLHDQDLPESMGKRGREGILRDHTWQITTQKILHFIDRIQDV